MEEMRFRLFFCNVKYFFSRRWGTLRAFRQRSPLYVGFRRWRRALFCDHALVFSAASRMRQVRVTPPFLLGLAALVGFFSYGAYQEIDQIYRDRRDLVQDRRELLEVRAVFAKMLQSLQTLEQLDPQKAQEEGRGWHAHLQEIQQYERLFEAQGEGAAVAPEQSGELIQSRLHLLQKQKDLEEELREARRLAQTQTQRLQDRETDLTRLRAENEAHELEQKKLRGSLYELTASQTETEKLLQSVDELLQTGTGAMARLAGKSPENLVDLPVEQRIRFFLETVQALHEGQIEQRDLIEKLSASYDTKLEQHFSILEETRFPIEKMQKRGYLFDALGGPEASDSIQRSPEDETGEGTQNLFYDSLAGIGSVTSEMTAKLEQYHKVQKLLSCYPIRRPVRGTGRLSSGYGNRKHPVTRRTEFHRGIDYAARSGTPVYPAAAGRVTRVLHSNRGYGNSVQLDHGCGFQSLYAHLRAIKVKRGAGLTEDTVLGTVGNTGRSTGPHLHFEILYEGRNYNPLPFVKAGLRYARLEAK